ncbi:MAG: mannose-1-phosphate guanylyltransferase [Akkermansia sp.]
MSDHYALILAGGSGTRFWPLSRNTHPKQLLDLFGDGTLLRQTLERVKRVLPAENIIILTNRLQEAELRRQAPELPPENIVAEPLRRDTAPAVALGIGLIAARCPQAEMMVLPSDALIRDDEAFCRQAREALALAERESALITIGIKPTWPCPSYGYIERAARLEDAALSSPCYEVARFCEKPDAALAAQYLEQGNFVWNAGMFVWNVAHVRRELTVHAPELAQFVTQLCQSKNPRAAFVELFAGLTPISIDYALMEKAQRVLNLEAAFDWDDVGSWISVGSYLPRCEGNAANTPLSCESARDNIVYSAGGKRVALVGVSDLIVVDTDDALLICRREQADAIRRIVGKLPPELT